MMKPPNHVAARLFCAVFFVTAAVQADPVFSNVTIAQREGTKLVDITYDLSGATPASTVTLSVSHQGTALAATSVTGAVGVGIADGSGQTIVWDAGADADHALLSLSFSLTAVREFAWIPEGDFTMGDAQDGLTNAPQHTVNVPGFYIGTHEVSYGLWQEVRAWALDNGYTDLYDGSVDGWDEVGAGKGDDHPVHSVSWYDAVKWCNAASERAGLEPVYYLSEDGVVDPVYRSDAHVPYIDYSKQGYRLPTEAEWEKAARGGVSSDENGPRFQWGNEISHNEANYKANSVYAYDYSGATEDTFHPDYSGDGEAMPYTAPVGSFAANDYGLYDMSGNLWEWCNDRYVSSYYSSPDRPDTDPQGPDTGSNRVRRGGSWVNDARYSRVAHRNYTGPGGRSDRSGFRLVLRTQ
jgi:sulfatase modifying factor 1